MTDEITRREFMARTGKTAVVGLGAPAGLSSARQAFAAVQPGRVIGADDRIRMALIGCGGQGRFNIHQFMGHSDVETTGVCDVDRRRTHGRWEADA
jgi:hypothetical protein